MSFVRRLALGLLTVALLAGAAVAAGYAMRIQSGSGDSTAVEAPYAAPPASPESSPRPRTAPVQPAPVQPVVDTPVRSPQTPTIKAGTPVLVPGDEGDEVRDLQARLAQLAWYFGDIDGTYGDETVEAVRGFQEKRGIAVNGVVDQRTLDRLHAMSYDPSRDQLGLHNIPGPLDARCLTGRVICVDKTSRTLRWMIDGKVIKTLDVRFGGSSTPTREGSFTVGYKNRDHVSKLYGSSMPFAMFFSGGQAVHYSSDFAGVGYAGASHGCVNVRDYEGVAWLFDQVVVGDKVVVYWS
jgi:peptidoglycan hydrolase-like protein with peptidoglycan-binding domain